MKFHSLLSLQLLSLMAFHSCQSSKGVDMEKMERKEIEMLQMLRTDAFYTEEETDQESGTYYDSLTNWVLTDTATFSYPFTRSIENGNLTIADSDDRCLRFYSWDTEQGGSMTMWGNLIQFRSGQDVKAVHQSIDRQLHPDAQFDEFDFGSYIDTIYTFPCANGSKLYLAESYSSMSGNYSANYLLAMRIQDGNLVSAPCFVRQGKRTDQIGLEHSVASWYFIANLGEGWDWIFRYDQEAQNLYVASTDSMETLIDRYDIYHFNGSDFIYQKTGGPFWLYPELREYQRLELLFKTKDYMIRIDNLDGETMRYTSWKSTQQMSDVPQVVLTGEYNEEENTFLFSQGSYNYAVTLEPNVCLKVLHHGEVILQQKQETQTDGN